MMNAWNVRLEHGLQLAAAGLLHAALETFEALLQSVSEADKHAWIIYDEVGKIHVQWGQAVVAEAAFTKAAQLAPSLDERAKCQMHLAMTQHAQGNFDRAYRLLSDLLLNQAELTDMRMGVLYNNLASVQWATQFYRDAVVSMHRSVAYFDAAGVADFNGRLYNNIGVCYLELRAYEQAEQYLELGLAFSGDESLFSLFGLSRLHFHLGNLQRSVDYATQAIPLLESVAMNFERVKLAHSSRLLAELAYQMGDNRTAIQLMEKAELLFGMQDYWTAWSEAQARLNEWTTDKQNVESGTLARDTSLMGQFLWFVESMNAQELLSPHFGQLIDTRVEYANALADALQVPWEARKHLIYAARLSDYGLTALGPEIALDPTRSDAAWQQYEQHPALSVNMLQDLHLADEVYNLIVRHHERRDARGFPNGPEADEQGVLDDILHVADDYATSVVLHGLRHSEAMAYLVNHASGYDPTVRFAMEKLFLPSKGEFA